MACLKRTQDKRLTTFFAPLQEINQERNHFRPFRFGEFAAMDPMERIVIVFVVVVFNRPLLPSSCGWIWETETFEQVDITRTVGIDVAFLFDKLSICHRMFSCRSSSTSLGPCLVPLVLLALLVRLLDLLDRRQFHQAPAIFPRSFETRQRQVWFCSWTIHLAL